jgi:hypothetical protein
MHLEPSDERVTLQEPIHLTWGQIDSVHKRYKKRTYLGIHSACEDIANRVMRTPRPEKAGIRVLGDLWMTLERRKQKSNWEYNAKVPFLSAIPSQIPGDSVFLELYNYCIPRECIHERNPRHAFYTYISGCYNAVAHLQEPKTSIDWPLRTVSLHLEYERLYSSASTRP